MAKWDESKHPRHPKGTSQGGEFAPAGSLVSWKSPGYRGMIEHIGTLVTATDKNVAVALREFGVNPKTGQQRMSIRVVPRGSVKLHGGKSDMPVTSSVKAAATRTLNSKKNVKFGWYKP